MIVENATSLANFYNTNRQHSADAIKAFLSARGVTVDSISDLAKVVNEELLIEQERHNKECDAPPGMNMDHVLSSQFLKKIADLGVQDISDDPADIHYIMGVISKTAYKYQLKYALTVIDVMVNDKEIWEEIIIH